MCASCESVQNCTENNRLLHGIRACDSLTLTLARLVMQLRATLSNKPINKLYSSNIPHYLSFVFVALFAYSISLTLGPFNRATQYTTASSTHNRTHIISLFRYASPSHFFFGGVNAMYIIICVII